MGKATFFKVFNCGVDYVASVAHKCACINRLLSCTAYLHCKRTCLAASWQLRRGGLRTLEACVHCVCYACAQPQCPDALQYLVFATLHVCQTVNLLSAGHAAQFVVTPNTTSASAIASHKRRPNSKLNTKPTCYYKRGMLARSRSSLQLSTNGTQQDRSHGSPMWGT